MGLSVTRTIRLQNELDDVLQSIAKDERMTVNFIVNQSVRRYVEWDRHAEKFDFVEIGPALLAELIGRQTLDDARDLGRQAAKNIIRPSVEYIFVDFRLENVIELFRRYSKYSRLGHFEDSVEGRKHVLLIRHSFGSKWSAFLEGLLRGVLEEELGIKAKLTTGPETCVARFELQATPELGRV